MVEVDDRSTPTLLPIIQRHILPGTTVTSDQWRVYCCLGQSGFNHETVNQFCRSAVMQVHAHTQNVESMWGKAKSKQKQGNGTAEALFNSYLQEYLLRRQFGDFPFENIVKHIAEVYNM